MTFQGNFIHVLHVPQPGLLSWTSHLMDVSFDLWIFLTSCSFLKLNSCCRFGPIRRGKYDIYEVTTKIARSFF